MKGMAMNQATSVYKQINITTSNPLKIILMLYDGAINFLNMAVDFANHGDIKQKNIYANKARDIIEELNNSLNTEVGGELAQNLRGLYLFMNRHLMQANWHNDTRAMNEVLQMLTGLREAWQDVYDQHETPAEPLRMAAGMRV